ncbi:MAG TPA: toll/interleukin-1 receptor domain-containing protein [Vicinamibacterales bacterium]|nr:toll/interleukin-1 receptor domain-containing protein [Vicinamibacterales bacterium]
MAHDVFISYASSDKVVADAVCSQLESLHRIRCWIAPRDVTPGASWAESIIDALDGSKIMVLIFSSNANASAQIEREVERAVHKGINIIPLRIEDTMPTKTLEYFISAPHWLDALSAPLESHINKLAASVKALLAKSSTHTPQFVAPMTPPVAAPPPVVTAPPSAAPPSAAHHDRAPARSNTFVPMLILSGIAVGVVAFVLRPTGGTPASSTERPAEVATAAAVPTGTSAAAIPPATAPVQSTAAPSGRSSATSAAAASAPASTVSSTSAPAKGATAGRLSAAPAASAASTGAAGTSAAKPAAAAASPAAAVSTGKPNLFIDLANNLSEGTLSMEVDGQKAWTQKLGPGVKGGTLSLATGSHKVTMTLLDPKGKVKETRSISLIADPVVARTLNVRLSRFKKDLELQTVVRAPKAEPAPAAAKAADSGSTETKTPASKPAASKPAASKPATAAKP